MLGTLLNGRYRLIRVLGSGGFGQTFVAVDEQSDGLKCVVKQFKPVSQDSMILDISRRLFLNESEILRKLGIHDRIPTLLHNFEQDEQFYLVQEYVEGRSLSDELIILHKLSESQVVALLRDVLEILEFVHGRNVIHRDIKPSNLIRRQRDNRLVLIDFGAVKEINTQVRESLEPTKLTVGIATQGYAPTEQLAGKPRLNSDLYALGMTAIQTLTGLHPSQLPTHPVTGEVIWRDRADVSLWLASILDKLVRYHFNDRFQSVADVLAALDQTALVQPTNMQHLAGWNDETLIPPTEMRQMATVLTKGEIPLAVKPRSQRGRWASALGASVVAAGLAVGMKQLGWLQPLELAAFDRMVQVRPAVRDDRILVVGITEADIQQQKRFPLSDQVVAKTLQQLQRHKPRAIGLDLFRDIPQAPGRDALLSALKAPNIVVITNLGTPITPPPPTVPADRVGFNDVVLDPDSVVRRNLMFAHASDGNDSFSSFSLRLATLYLESEGVKMTPSLHDRTVAQLGKTELLPLTANSGGYGQIDDRGYQIMAQYRGKQAIRQVSLESVLNGTVPPEQVQDKVVLIGTTAANAKDLFLTPYSPIERETPRMPGVFIHAHLVSQLLSIGLDGQQPVWFWSELLEIAWIAGWAIVAGGTAWLIAPRPLVVLLAEGLLLVGLIGISYGLFLQNGWVPVVAPAIALVLAGGGVAIASRYNRQ